MNIFMLLGCRRLKRNTRERLAVLKIISVYRKNMMDFKNIDTSRAALLMMHFQADVFAALAGHLPPDMLDRANALIKAWRTTGRPVIFANFALGPHYESVTEKNMLTMNIQKMGLFREPTPVAGLDVKPNDGHYACPRASVFHSTKLDQDLRAQGIDTLVMAGIASSGVLFSSVAWASDADYRLYLVQDCCYDPDTLAHEALFRTSFATRTTII
ncbi:cysteine hydrolase family protein [Bdellovibrio bacteriovorus]|nr:isochorismatase family cysteine hydrolase [Bdellovibrio bacteriovorus]